MTLVYRIGWLFFRLLYRIYVPAKRFGVKNIPPSGRLLLCSNHASFYDPPLIGTGLTRQCSFMARESLLRFRFTRWLLTHWQCIPVDREGSSASAMKRVLEALELERAVVLFPEGTRTLDGGIRPARAGIGMIVIKSGAPVLPIRIWGTFEAWGKHVKYPKPGRLVIHYGQLLHFTELRAEAKTCSKERLREIYQQIADELMAAIAKLEPREQ